MVTEFLYCAKAVILPCNEHYNLQLIYYNKFQTKSKHFTVLSPLPFTLLRLGAAVDLFTSAWHSRSAPLHDEQWRYQKALLSCRPLQTGSQHGTRSKPSAAVLTPILFTDRNPRSPSQRLLNAGLSQVKRVFLMSLLSQKKDTQILLVLVHFHLPKPSSLIFLKRGFITSPQYSEQILQAKTFYVSLPLFLVSDSGLPSLHGNQTENPPVLGPCIKLCLMGNLISSTFLFFFLSFFGGGLNWLMPISVIPTLFLIGF